MSSTRKGGAHIVDHMQVTAVVPSLSALLAHPEFQKGLAVGHEFFFDSYEEAPLTEEEMIEEVEWNLSRHIVARGKKIARLIGDEPPSCFYNLGYVIGTIEQGLTYTR
jgi:hypothetical protein